MKAYYEEWLRHNKEVYDKDIKCLNKQIDKLKNENEDLINKLQNKSKDNL